MAVHSVSLNSAALDFTSPIQINDRCSHDLSYRPLICNSLFLDHFPPVLRHLSSNCLWVLIFTSWKCLNFNVPDRDDTLVPTLSHPNFFFSFSQAYV